MKQQLKQNYDNLDQGVRLISLQVEGKNEILAKIQITVYDTDSMLGDKIKNLLKLINE